MNSKFFPLITTTLYALVGVVFLGWDVFFLVYLFWFENFIRIFSYRFKANAISHVKINNEIVLARDSNGRLIDELRTPFSTRLFMYFVYFVFIIVGGFIFSILIPNEEGVPNALLSFVSIVCFQHLDFNVAILLCILNEVAVYYRDFKINKIYTEKFPYKAPSAIEKEDIVLHISIILTAIFAFAGTHPSFKEMLGTDVSNAIFKNLMYIPGIILISIKFIIVFYSIKSDENAEEGGGINLPPEKEDILNRLNNIK